MLGGCFKLYGASGRTYRLSALELAAVIMLLLALSFMLFAGSYSDSIDTVTEHYTWNKREAYYFESLQGKMKDTLSSGCISKVTFLGDGSIVIPSTSTTLNAASMPVKANIMKWWKNIPKPSQMRVDPHLCDAVAAKRLSIFNQTGCQLPGYMSPSAPRCQNKYMKYICDQSRTAIDDQKGKSFVILESDHNNTELPPQPWLLTARNSFVSMCGDISTDCGVVHTTSNCLGTRFKSQAKLFQSKCKHSLIKYVSSM